MAAMMNAFASNDVFSCYALTSEEPTCNDLISCVQIIGSITNSGGVQLNENCFGAVASGAQYQWSSQEQIDQYDWMHRVISVGMACSGDNGGGDSTDWDYYTTCDANRDGCGTGCCDVDMSYFGASGTDAFECGQLAMAVEEYERKDTVMRCLRAKCGGGGDKCFATGGLFGNPAWDENDSRNQGSQSVGTCIAAIHDNCATNPTSPKCKLACPFTRCNGDACPCEESTCQAYYDADFNTLKSCKPFFDSVKRDYVTQGFLYPESEWTRANFIKQGLANIAPSGDVVLSNATLALAEQCSLDTEIISCVNTTMEYCNTEEGFNSQGCRALSVCGDGLLTWGEMCDDGNNAPYQDGCRECQWVPENFYCPGPGEKCEVCIMDSKSNNNNGGQTGGQPVSEGCPFCRNNKLKELVSPCAHADCRVVNSYVTAQACDTVAEAYCGAIATGGFVDPGCADFKPMTRLFSTPQIPACYYEVKVIDIGADYLKKLSYAVITCPLIDPTKEGRDTAPFVQYTNPMHMLSSNDLDALAGNNKTVLELLSAVKGFEKGSMVPFAELGEFELFEHYDTSLNNNGESIMNQNYYRNRLARLNLAATGSNDMNGGDEWCESPSGIRELNPLPLYEDSNTALTSFVAREIKWRAKMGRDWELADFSDINIDGVVGNLNTEMKNNTLSFAMMISSTRKEWKNGRESEVVRKEYDCSRSGNYRWEDMETECDALGDLLASGNARVSFGSSLFQSGCVDENCEQKIAKCKQVPILPRKPKASLEKFKQERQRLQDAVLALDNTTDWGSVKTAIFEISSILQSAPMSGVFQIFKEVTISGKTQKWLKSVRDYCPHDYGTWSNNQWVINEDWLINPCCNWELRQYQCCPIQDVKGGVIETVVDFDTTTLGTFCSNPEQIQKTLTNLFTTMETQNKAASEMADKANPKLLDDIGSFDQECGNKIYNWNGDQTINSQADCFCSFSEYNSDQQRCVVDAADEYKCYAECFLDMYDGDYLLKEMKKHWNIASGAGETDAFIVKWEELMTEEGCRGGRQHESDIGYGGFNWVCDQECREENSCSARGVLQNAVESYNENQKGQGGQWMDSWSLSQNDADCTAFGGERKCINENQGTCYEYICWLPLMDNVSLPCSEESSCWQTCSAPCQEEQACVSSGGSWMPNQNNCCPADAYVHNNQYGQECKITPPGTPDGWSLNNEVCCASWGGKWRDQQCCLGEFVTQTWGFQEYTYCQEWVDTYKQCQECQQEICKPLQQECRTCQEDRNSCCAMQYVPQNQTACLRYETCNDASISIDEGGTCAGDEPFCSNNWGWVETQAPECQSFASSQLECEAIGFSWTGKCLKTLAYNSTIADCFPAGVPVGGSWASRFGDWEEPENGWARSVFARDGCYWVSNYTVQSNTTCQGNNNKPGELTTDTNGDTFCRTRHVGETPDSCLGVLINSSISFRSGRRNTQGSCEAGVCDGLDNRMHPTTKQWLDQQPWSSEQCAAGDSLCTRWCPVCQSWSRTNQGACFENSTEVSQENNVYIDQAACEANANYTWYECPQPPPSQIPWQELSNQCQAVGAIPQFAQDALQCSANWQRCPTEESCDAIGDCNSRFGYLDLETRICTTSDWEFGDSHYSTKIVTETDAVLNTTTSRSEWVECPWDSRKQIDGVCISSRPESGCSRQDQMHPFGCKTDGLHNSTVCEDAGNTWYNRINDRDSCEAVKACKLNLWDVRLISEEECLLCGGSLVQFAQWHGGKWIAPQNRPLTWHAEGRKVKSINQWVKTQASYKLKAELEIPVMKVYAHFKKLELMTKYVAFTALLETIACDCGGSNTTKEQCFGDSDGSLASQTSIYDTEIGSSEITHFAVLNSLGGNRRRRLDGSESELTIMSVSAGVFEKHEPCSGSDAFTFDTLVVKDSNDIIIGQVTGDGWNVNLTDWADRTLTLCFDKRDDIVIRDDMFSDLAVGLKANENTVHALVVANEAIEYEGSTLSRICFNATENGIYFPILRSSASSLTNGDAVGSCDPVCEAGGSCVLNGTAAELMCVCKCGFSGASCNSGCSNYCSNNGECNGQSNECACDMDATNENPLYVGDTCSRINCPQVDGLSCAGNGVCQIQNQMPTCVCTSGFEGDVCETQIVDTESAGADNGFGDSPTISGSIDYGLPPSPYPTTSAPTRAQPEPLITVKVVVPESFLQGVQSSSNIEAALLSLETGFENLIPESQRGKVVIKASVVKSKKGSIDFIVSNGILDAGTLAILKEALTRQECGNNPKCEVEVTTGSRRLLAGRRLPTATASYDVTQTVESGDEMPAEVNTTANDISSLMNTVATEQSVTLEVTVDSLPAPVKKQTVSIKVVPTDDAINGDNSASLDSSSIQSSMSNSANVASTFSSSSGVTVESSSVAADLCDGRTCSGNGVCQESDGACICENNWSGVQCQNPPPTNSPTLSPSVHTSAPTSQSVQPTKVPTKNPSRQPTSDPTLPPTDESGDGDEDDINGSQRGIESYVVLVAALAIGFAQIRLN